ncbi:porin [Rhizobium lemnae]|uniref:Porin n=1 Tax=Rhizobium lemnae TaxID=1214924 RepID=A0ABV8EDN8_9HYPH|nr:porin [Rhizobium lemnae]MCJ8507414.1 porin [Rhizobium lemnae]
MPITSQRKASGDPKAVKVTGQFKITLGAQYFWTLDQNRFGDFTGNRDGWHAGLTFDYQLATNLSTKVAVNYQDFDNQQEQWTGFVRLQRPF